MKKELNLCQRWHLCKTIFRNTSRCRILAELIIFNTLLEFLSNKKHFHKEINFRLLDYKKLKSFPDEKFYYLLNFFHFLIFSYDFPNDQMVIFFLFSLKSIIFIYSINIFYLISQILIKKFVIWLTNFTNSRREMTLDFMNIKEVSMKIYSVQKANQ